MSEPPADPAGVPAATPPPAASPTSVTAGAPASTTWRPHVDTYDLRARGLPALLVAAPALALALALPFAVTGAQRLWGLLGLAIVPLAAALLRRQGNAVQPALWAAWHGPPTTRRLRWSTGPRTAIAARHAELRAVLGDRVALPTAAGERRDATAADSAYAEAVRRLLGLTRTDDRFRLLRRENANYGFARNLYGARRFALLLSGTTLLLTAAVGAYLATSREPASAAPLLLPALVSSGAVLVWWRLVTPDLVRPAAEAFADRLLEALQTLAQDRSR